MTRQEAIEEVKKLAGAPSVCAEAKQAAETYLSAVGTETEKKAAADLIAELEEDVTSVDDLIELTESAEGVKIFGENQAHSLNQAARERRRTAEFTASARPVRQAVRCLITGTRSSADRRQVPSESRGFPHGSLKHSVPYASDVRRPGTGWKNFCHNSVDGAEPVRYNGRVGS